MLYFISCIPECGQWHGWPCSTSSSPSSHGQSPDVQYHLPTSWRPWWKPSSWHDTCITCKHTGERKENTHNINTRGAVPASSHNSASGDSSWFIMSKVSLREEPCWMGWEGIWPYLRHWVAHWIGQISSAQVQILFKAHQKLHEAQERNHVGWGGGKSDYHRHGHAHWIGQTISSAQVQSGDICRGMLSGHKISLSTWLDNLKHTMYLF